MKTISKLLGIFAIICLIGTVTYISSNTIITAKQDTQKENPQTSEIKHRIVEAFNYKRLVNTADFDLEKADEFFIDSPNEHKLNPQQKELVETMLGKDALTNAGYLSASHVYFKNQYLANLELNNLFKSRIEESGNPDAGFITLEEEYAISLKYPNAYPTLYQTIDEVTQDTIDDYIWEDIDIKGNRAVVTFNDGNQIGRVVLLKVEGVWYIAGYEFLQNLV